MARFGKLQWELTARKRWLHVKANFADGWAERSKGPSFYAKCQGSESPDLFGRRITLEISARGPESLVETVETIESAAPYCSLQRGSYFAIAAGTVHWIIPFRSEDDLPNPDLFDAWHPQRPDGLKREWEAFLGTSGGAADFRFLLNLEPVSRGAPVVRIPSLRAPFVPGGLPSLGKRR